MTRRNRRSTHALACDSYGQLPHPAKARLTFANVVVAMLPIELVVHAAVVHTTMPYLLKILVLTFTATALVIWVAEPSVRTALQGWLHAPALRRRRLLHESAARWRVRTLTDDGAEGQEKLARGVAGAGADILVSRRHHVAGRVLDELIVASPDTVTHADLLAAAGAGDSRDVRVWPATALAVADGQTKALALALRVAEGPDELALAVAELLDAAPIANPAIPFAPVGDSSKPGAGGSACDGTVLKIPSPWQGPLRFTRPHAPFTPAESARAHRLDELAELTDLSRRDTVRAVRTPAP